MTHTKMRMGTFGTGMSLVKTILIIKFKGGWVSMKFEAKEAKGYWFISVTVKSGNKYAYNCGLYEEPTEYQMQRLWEEQRKKHWSRIG